MSLKWDSYDDYAVTIAKALAADAVQKAGSGHPGAPISLAPAAYLLFHKVMRHYNAKPQWQARDRFILSGGHASLLLYTQLFLGGFGLSIDDIKSIRTWGSLTPGHPEYGHTTGVEMTTGPLGQGLASAVGMAMAARRTHGLFTPEQPLGQGLFDHFVYVICGDGDLQEGVTAEACSLAGTQEIGNLIAIWDDNRISIEDDTCITFSEDVEARYQAYGWQTIHVDWRSQQPYSENVHELYDAICAAKQETSKPTLIRLSTIMAWPSPTKQNSGAAHGAALGEEEVAGLKEALGINPQESFAVDTDILTKIRETLSKKGQQQWEQWEENYQQWRASSPERACLYDRLLQREIPQDLDHLLPVYESGDMVATRTASGQVLSSVAKTLPEIWGGSADLAGSNNTTMKGEPSFLPANRQSKAFAGNPYGRTLHFGIREHAMGAILNGIALHGIHRPYGGTFFIFSDYMRPAVRLAALMNLPVTYVWTHDSIGVGEDGPTHQPIEHLWSYRAIPNIQVVRPADARETVAAWQRALANNNGPVALVLSRQNLPVLKETENLSLDQFSKGAYIIKEAPLDKIDALIIATGSEVQLAVQAQTVLANEGISVRVVSAPCLQWFDSQTPSYRATVLPDTVKARVSVEAGSTIGWHRYVGENGTCLGIDHYGASAAPSDLFTKFGLTVEALTTAVKETIARQSNK